MDRTVASAVVLSEPTPAPASPNAAGESPPSPRTLKRRQSSIDDSNGTKRPRISSQGEIQEDNPIERRRSSTTQGTLVEERKRGQRLFGAILGTLAQKSPSSAHQRKRAEIEQKQQAKLRQKDVEDEHRKRSKREELIGERRKEQKAWDERCMRARHRNLLAMAHSLKTKAEPQLYYRPWELRPEEDERIEQQKADAQRLVDREVAEFEESRQRREREGEMQETEEELQQRQQQRQSPESRPPDDAQRDDPDVHTGNGVPQKDPPSKENGQPAMQPPSHTAETSGNDVAPPEHDHDRAMAVDEHGGEELVEGQEDDVIY